MPQSSPFLDTAPTELAANEILTTGILPSELISAAKNTNEIKESASSEPSGGIKSAQSAVADPASPSSSGPSRRRAIITVGLMLGMLITAMESTVISTAMPTVIGDLHGIELYPWVFSAYLLTSTTTVPVYGKLADLFGRRSVFLGAASIFLIGSMLSGAAHSMWQLIAFRALQGLGAGGVLPLTLTVIGDIYTLRERARVQGLFTSMWGISSLSGPILGAFLTEHLSWRWVFYINLPFGVASMLLVGAFLREPQRPRTSHSEMQMDYAGVGLLTGSVVAVLWLLLKLGAGLPVLSMPVLVPLLLSLGLTWAFVRQERRAPSPLLPLALFAHPVIAASIVGNILIGTMMYAIDSYMPLFMQGVRGGGAHSASLVLTPLVLLWSLSAYAGARALARFGFGRVALFGVCCISSSALCLAGISIHTPTAFIVAIMALLGMGLGPCSIAFLVAAQSAVSWEQRGVVTASAQFFRMISGTLSVGVLGAILNARLTAGLRAQAHGVSPNALLNATSRAAMPPALLRAAQDALAQGLHLVFVLLALASFAALARVAQLAGRGALKADPPAEPSPEQAASEDSAAASPALSVASH